VAVASAALEDGVALEQSMRDRRVLPNHPLTSAWVLASDDDDVDEIRISASLFTLADGTVGASGGPIAAYPGGQRWVVAGNVYVGEGPDTRLLTAPIAMHMPYELSERPRVRRSQDLHAGILHDEETTVAGRMAGLQMRVRFLGTHVHLHLERNLLKIHSEGPLRVQLGGGTYDVDRGRLTLHRRDRVWEELT
jgi:hypothetical protein